MVMLPFFVSSLLASSAIAGTIHLKRDEPVHTCGVRSSSEEEKEFYKRQSSEPDNGQPIDLGAIVTFCCTEADCPSDDVAKKAVDDMNSVIKESKINFNLEKVKRTTDGLCNSGLENDSQIDELKSHNHEGNSSTLNIVYVPTNKGSGTKGMCVKPEPNSNMIAAMGTRDGCAVAMDTLPGQGNKNGLGARASNQLYGPLITTTHEMGHWLSLDHVGQGSQGQRPGFNGWGSLFGRQSNGGTGNVMEPMTTPGKSYEFDEQQFKQMRQTALKRLQQKGSPTQGQNPSSPQQPNPNPQNPNPQNPNPQEPNSPQNPNGNPQGPAPPSSPSPDEPGFPGFDNRPRPGFDDNTPGFPGFDNNTPRPRPGSDNNGPGSPGSPGSANPGDCPDGENPGNGSPGQPQDPSGFFNGQGNPWSSARRPQAGPAKSAKEAIYGSLMNIFRRARKEDSDGSVVMHIARK